MSVLHFGPIRQVDVEIFQQISENFHPQGPWISAPYVTEMQPDGSNWELPEWRNQQTTRHTYSRTKRRPTAQAHSVYSCILVGPWHRTLTTTLTDISIMCWPLRATRPPLKTQKKNYPQRPQVLHTWREDLWKSKLDIAANEFSTSWMSSIWNPIQVVMI